MSSTFLSGTEALTLELDGTIDATDARRLVPAAFELDGTEVEVNLLIFRMKSLAVDAVPKVGLDYSEALWRVAIRHDSAPAWYAAACDLDHPFVRLAGKRLIRYPVRHAAFELTDRYCRIRAGAIDFELRIDEPAEEFAPRPARRIFTSTHRTHYEIPWAEAPATSHRLAAIAEVGGVLGRRTFGESLVWSDRARVLEGRTHRCGLARRV